jgi:hypothetical protein
MLQSHRGCNARGSVVPQRRSRWRCRISRTGDPATGDFSDAKDALKDVGEYTSSGGATPYVFGSGAPSPLLVIPLVKSDEVIVVKKGANSR